MKILAVDDNPLVLDMLTSLFEKTEFPKISVAASSKEALAMLQDPAREFDCLILDIEMPGMNGIELCKAIRTTPGHHDTPIIMLTTRRDVDAIDDAFAAGANDYIFKRFNIKEFTNRVRIASRLNSEKNDCLVIGLDALQSTPRAEIKDFDFDRSVMIQGTPGMILPFSLGNYLTQMPLDELDKRALFAMKMDSASDILAEYGDVSFLMAVQSAAAAIVDAAKPDRVLVAYLGSGIFMCITRDSNSDSIPDLTEPVSEMLAGALKDLGIPGDKLGSVTVGKPVQPQRLHIRRVKSSFKRALERLGAQCLAKGNAA